MSTAKEEAKPPKYPPISPEEAKKRVAEIAASDKVGLEWGLSETGDHHGWDVTPPWPTKDNPSTP